MRNIFLGGVALALSAGMAFSHGEASRPTNGGISVMAEFYHAEIRVSPGEVAVWVVDHAGEPMDLEGWSGQAVILQDSDRIDLDLTPGMAASTPENDAQVPALVAQDDAINGNDGDRVTVTLTDAEAATEEFRITVGAEPAAEAAHQH